MTRPTITAYEFELPEKSAIPENTDFIEDVDPAGSSTTEQATGHTWGTDSGGLCASPVYSTTSTAALPKYVRGPTGSIGILASTGPEPMIAISGTVVHTALALLILWMLLWSVSLFRGKSAFRTFLVLLPSYIPGILLHTYAAEIATLNLRFASYQSLNFIAIISLSCAVLLSLDTTGVLALVDEFWRATKNWYNGRGWKFGWGWSKENEYVRPSGWNTEWDDAWDEFVGDGENVVRRRAGHRNGNH